MENLAETQNGLYMAVKYTESSKELIKQIIMKSCNIPNCLDVDKIHTTLIYSRTNASVHTNTFDFSRPVATIIDYEIWKTQSGENALVAKLDCNYLTDRHKQIMSDNPHLTYDYDEYKPHITISYNVPADFDIKVLPKNVFLVIDHEYQEELKLDWAKSS